MQSMNSPALGNRLAGSRSSARCIACRHFGSSPDIMAGLDPKWRHAIQRALDREPANRFPSAGEFMDCILCVGIGPAVPIHKKQKLLIGAVGTILTMRA